MENSGSNQSGKGLRALLKDMVGRKVDSGMVKILKEKGIDAENKTNGEVILEVLINNAKEGDKAAINLIKQYYGVKFLKEILGKDIDE